MESSFCQQKQQFFIFQPHLPQKNPELLFDHSLKTIHTERIFEVPKCCSISGLSLVICSTRSQSTQKHITACLSKSIAAQTIVFSVSCSVELPKDE